ncbi:MAG: hypothetical protein H6867_08300 [Rhodospirillales bacterium]|nr:hypothetical protein [Rhodospirillales bacterium]MCB9995558.1 hypothetical protein [Rhodospirillales bacterium]
MAPAAQADWGGIFNNIVSGVLNDGAVQGQIQQRIGDRYGNFAGAVAGSALRTHANSIGRCYNTSGTNRQFRVDNTTGRADYDYTYGNGVDSCHSHSYGSPYGSGSSNAGFNSNPTGYR